MKVTPSCTFISTKSTVVTIGVLSLVISVICSINLFIGVYKVSLVVQNPGTESDAVISLFLALGYQAIFLTLLLLTCVDIFADILMIMGTFKKKASYIFPWLALRFGGMACVICMCTAFVIISAVSFSIQESCLVFLVSGSVCTLAICFWLIVYGHYKDVIKESLGVEHPNDGKVLAAGPIPYRNI